MIDFIVFLVFGFSVFFVSFAVGWIAGYSSGKEWGIIEGHKAGVIYAMSLYVTGKLDDERHDE